jgi:hypothetical protein
VDDPEPLPAELVEPPATKPTRPVRVAAAVSSRRRVTATAERRSDADLQAELTAAIDSGRLPAEPSAEAIRTALKEAPARTRTLRDALRPA